LCRHAGACGVSSRVRNGAEGDIGDVSDDVENKFVVGAAICSDGAHRRRVLGRKQEWGKGMRPKLRCRRGCRFLGEREAAFIETDVSSKDHLFRLKVVEAVAGGFVRVAKENAPSRLRVELLDVSWDNGESFAAKNSEVRDVGDSTSERLERSESIDGRRRATVPDMG
jgi:hypothetical protein